jgi:heat shock protein HtpX
MTTLDHVPRMPSVSEAVAYSPSPTPVREQELAGFLRAGILHDAFARLFSVLCRHRSELWLLGPMSLYLAFIFSLAFGIAGFIIAFVIAGLLAYLGRRLSADTFLQHYRTQEIAPNQGLSLKAGLAELSSRAGLAKQPRIAIIPTVAIGAFSVGNKNCSAILLSEGLLRRFSLAEIIAILAHEIAHIRAGDLGFFALADLLTRFTQVLAYLGVALFLTGTGSWLAGEPFVAPSLITSLLLAPFLNSQLQLHLSRQREYEADAEAARLLGDTSTLRSVVLAMEPDWGSPFDDFRLPVPQRRSPIPSPARAHLAQSERLRHLAALHPMALMPPLQCADEPLVSLIGVGPIEMRPRNRWPGLWF